MADGRVAVVNTAKSISEVHCPHKEASAARGLALITVGDSLRGEPSIASSLYGMLPKSALDNVCRFDLGPYINCLNDCLPGHVAAIIIDNTQNGTAAGTVSLIDLSAMLDRAAIMNVSSSHGFALAHELRIAKTCGTLPKRVILLGVEIDPVDWTKKLSPVLEAKLPQLVENLSLLVTKVLETLSRAV